jgi:phenylacetate-CoA ligase
MGVWVAGNYTLECFRYLARQGYNLTNITPGIEKADILNILKKLSSNFKTTILAGYPSFVMDILVESKKQKVNLPNSLKILTAGDSFTENWRDEVLKFTTKKNNPEDVISIYGSADAGLMGIETPLSIFLRREAQKNKILFEKLFGKTEKQPALVQFFPEHIYIESLNGELVLTTNTPIPLVRYNIHDVGNVLDFPEMLEILKELGLYKKAKEHNLLNWNLPFVIKHGRTDVSVTYYALNIYPEHIQAGLQNPKLNNYVSGSFKAYNQTTNKHKNEKLVIEVELKNKIKDSHGLVKKISHSILNNLVKFNIEFRKLYAVLGSKAIPKIKLTSQMLLKEGTKKTLLNIKGKKPKIILKNA